MRVFALLLLLLLGLGLLPSLSAPVQAQRSGWSTPFELSPPINTEERIYGSSWFPAIAAAPDASLFVTWYSGKRLDPNEGGSLDLLMLREQRNGRWSEIAEAAAPATGGLTVRNSIVVARDGRLHAVYRSNTTIVHASVPLDRTRDAAAWSEPTRLSGYGAAYYTALATDSEGALHVLYSEAISDEPGEPNLICPGCSDLFYRRSTNGGRNWSDPINLSQTTEGENRPQIQIDRFDRIHAVWDEGIDWYAGRGEPRSGIYRRSDNGGKTWTEPVRFQLPASVVAQVRRSREQTVGTPTRATPTPRGTPAAPTSTAPIGPRHLDAVVQTTIGLDGLGNPLVVFRGAYWNRLYTAVSTDGGNTWGVPAEISGLVARSSDLDRYTMASDGGGQVHLLAAAYLPTADLSDPFAPIQLWHLTWNGRTWVGREAVMQNELYPEWPGLVVTGGNQLHAVWFTRSREDLFQSERARYRVWYGSRPIGAPEVTALPIFTPIPSATTLQTEATATTLPATPTPLPPELANLPPSSGRPTWELNGMLTIALALVPVMLLLGGVVLLHLLRGRRR